LDHNTQDSSNSNGILDKQNFFLYSPEIDGKLEAKKNNLISIPEEDNFKIRSEKDSFSHQNGKVDSTAVDNSDNSVEKIEIIFSNDYLRKEFKLKIVQKTYDTEIIEWLFNVNFNFYIFLKI
jgi:hypothetical protein